MGRPRGNSARRASGPLAGAMTTWWRVAHLSHRNTLQAHHGKMARALLAAWTATCHAWRHGQHMRPLLPALDPPSAITITMTMNRHTDQADRSTTERLTGALAAFQARWRVRPARPPQRPTPAAAVAPTPTYTHLMALAGDIARMDPHGLSALAAAILRPCRRRTCCRPLRAHPTKPSTRRARAASFLRTIFSPLPTRPTAAIPPPSATASIRPATSSSPRHGNAASWRRPWPTRRRIRPGAAGRAMRPTRSRCCCPGVGLATAHHHASAAAILTGAAPITPTDAIDLAPLLKRVGCDGRHYAERATGRILGRVADQRLGALYELGWLMTRHDAGLQPLASSRDDDSVDAA